MFVSSCNIYVNTLDASIIIKTISILSFMDNSLITTSLSRNSEMFLNTTCIVIYVINSNLSSEYSNLLCNIWDKSFWIWSIFQYFSIFLILGWCTCRRVWTSTDSSTVAFLYLYSSQFVFIVLCTLSNKYNRYKLLHTLGDKRHAVHDYNCMNMTKLSSYMFSYYNNYNIVRCSLWTWLVTKKHFFELSFKIFLQDFQEILTH